jgi:hypothetical protein
MTDSNFAFIVTTKVTNTTHKYILIECIRHIRIIYPEHVIYVINDNSNKDVFPLDELVDYNIELVDSLVTNGGEINPYLFILDDRCKNERLIYIHDSVFIKKPIENHILDKNNFIPIWYSSKYIWYDIFIPQNMDILNSMIFYGMREIKLIDLLYSLKKSKNKFLVTFGAMGLFNKKFVEFIRDNTNFFSIVDKFKNRNNRCLFERILSCIYILMYKEIYNKSICGDINYHPLSFKNTDIYINNYNNYFIKVWQGR